MLYHREDMFYLVTATIVMHNMMVEVRVNNDKDKTENFMTLETLILMKVVWRRSQ